MIITVTVSPAVPLASSGNTAKVASANDNRVGLAIYNNSANTIYCKYGSPGNAGTDMTFPIATFATWWMPFPIFAGEIYAVRNSGSGAAVATDMSSR